MTSVLLVEDEALIADDIQRTLTRLGYEVPVTAATGREAIRAVDAQRPSLVLMDIKLQGAMDGIEAASEIRKRFNVPVVYLTSHSDEGTLARARESSPFGYLIKPFNERELRASIEIALRAHAITRSTEEREHRLLRALEAANDAVIVVDEHGAVVFMNAPAESLTGWGYGEAVGRALSDVLVVLPIRDGQERIASRADGRMRDVERRQLPVADALGRRVGEVVLLRSVDRGEADGDRMRAIGRVASSIGHELNNPLAAVVASAWFARDLVEDVAYRAPTGTDVSIERGRFTELQGALSDVHEGAERARHVVNQLRRFVAPSVRTTRTTRPGKVLEDALKLASLEGVEVERRFGATPDVDVDETQLTHAVACLLENAAEAARAAGQPRIELAMGTDDAGSAQLEVRDRGAGVPAGIRARVFEPFFSTKREGARLGLGLTVAEQAVNEARGALTLEDRDGGGTVARVTLPPAKVALATGGHARSRARVLVVDDEPAVTRSLQRSLQSEFDVVVAGGGEEALALLLSGEAFDVVFTDVVMPDLPGDALYSRVCDALPDLARRFVFVTGGGLDEATEFRVRASSRMIVAKPFMPSTVRAVAHSVVDAERVAAG